MLVVLGCYCRQPDGSTGTQYETSPERCCNGGASANGILLVPDSPHACWIGLVNNAVATLQYGRRSVLGYLYDLASMLAKHALLGLVLDKRRFHFPVDLGVGSDLLEKRCQQIRRFLGVLHGEDAARLKGPMEHLEHLDSLHFVEVQQDVLADDHAQPLSHGAKRKQIAPGKRHLSSQLRDDLDETGGGGRAKILVKDIRWNALDLLFSEDARGHLFSKARCNIGGMDANVSEDVVGHPLSQQDGQRVGFRPVGASSVPQVNERAATEAGESLVDRQLQRLCVAEKEGEGHVRSVGQQIPAGSTADCIVGGPSGGVCLRSEWGVNPARAARHFPAGFETPLWIGEGIKERV